MMWWREAGGECIFPLPSARLKLLWDTTQPHPSRAHHHHGSHCLVSAPLSQETPQATPRLSD